VYSSSNKSRLTTETIPITSSKSRLLEVNPIVIDFGDISLYVDGKSLFYLTGTELDFSDGLNGKGFVFNNPNATKSCGCGESFGV
jgi:iron-sulfur cluster assembly accessory protein